MPHHAIASHLLARIKERPLVGVICGSGLSNLSDCLENPQTFHYKDIPGFPVATVPGHAGELVFGTTGGVTVVCMRGRFHYYEGNSMETVVLPVRVMRLLGVKLLIVTNAAGGLNPIYNIGDIMVIQDHFGMPAIAGNHPLRGLNDDAIGPRFPAVRYAFGPPGNGPPAPRWPHIQAHQNQRILAVRYARAFACPPGTAHPLTSRHTNTTPPRPTLTLNLDPIVSKHRF